MTTPAVRPESAVLPTNALGYVDIVNFRPPVGALVPDRNEPEVQAALAYANERRQPDAPLRVLPVDGGLALVDVESYRRWWALRHVGSGIGQVKAEWVEVITGEGAPTAPLESRGASARKRREVVVATGPSATVRLPLDGITVDPDIQTRAAMNDDTVADYAEAMLAGARFPPVDVFREGKGTAWLADGFHRVAAAHHAGLADIDVVVHPGGRREALLHAVGANARHGLRRTIADRRRAIEALLRDPEWGARSDNWIAERCGVDHKTVAAVRSTWEFPKCSAVETADGRVMKTARIGRRAAAERDPESNELGAGGGSSGVEVGQTDPAVEPNTVPTAIASVTSEDPAEATASPEVGEPPRTRGVTSPSEPDADRAAGTSPLLADLDRAERRIVDRLRNLAVTSPADAAIWAERHVAAVAAAASAIP